MPASVPIFVHFSMSAPMRSRNFSGALDRGCTICAERAFYTSGSAIAVRASLVIRAMISAGVPVGITRAVYSTAS